MTQKEFKDLIKWLDDPKRRKEARQREKEYYDQLFNTPVIKKAVDDWVKKNGIKIK